MADIDIDIDIDTGTVTVPVDLGIWQDGQRLDLRLDEPTPVGMFLDDLVRLLGLPRRTWDGQLIDYWLHPRGRPSRRDRQPERDRGAPERSRPRGIAVGAGYSR